MRQLVFTQNASLVQDENGAVRVIGSRITLDTIVQNFMRGATAEQIQDSFPSLTLREIYGAIFYYLGHQNEVERYLQERQGEADVIRNAIEQQPQYSEFRQKMRERRLQLVRV